MFGIFKLLRSRDVVDPELYFRCYVEVLGWMIVISYIVTLFFNPEYLVNNFIYNTVGYNNACVAFDSYPAKLFASPIFSMSIYLGLRYVVTELERFSLLHTNKKHGCLYHLDRPPLCF